MNKAANLSAWTNSETTSAGIIDFSNKTWNFGLIGQVPYGHYLRLFADQRIGGYAHPNETYWRVENNLLTFYDQTGQTKTVFDKCRINEAGQHLFTGHVVNQPNLQHYLMEAIEPYSISKDSAKFLIDKHFKGKSRRNLVIMGANEKSLHHKWPRNLSDANRTWDLCLSFYGDAKNYASVQGAEYTSLQTGTRKWQAIHSAMHETSPFWDYERIFVLDDDIMTSWKDINFFLEICRDLDLQLAQPSLKQNCCVNIPITAQVRGSYVRFTTYVEAMAPCFTSGALRKCIATTQGGYYGFGFDHIWPRILNLPKNKIGIVDAVSIDHTRPLATTYSLDQAHAEEFELFKLYGIPYQKIWQETGRLFYPG